MQLQRIIDSDNLWIRKRRKNRKSRREREKERKRGGGGGGEKERGRIKSEVNRQFIFQKNFVIFLKENNIIFNKKSSLIYLFELHLKSVLDFNSQPRLFSSSICFIIHALIHLYVGNSVVLVIRMWSLSLYNCLRTMSLMEFIPRRASIFRSSCEDFISPRYCQTSHVDILCTWWWHSLMCHTASPLTYIPVNQPPLL